MGDSVVDQLLLDSANIARRFAILTCLSFYSSSFGVVADHSHHNAVFLHVRVKLNTALFSIVLGKTVGLD